MRPISINKTNARKIFRWCKDHYGPSRFNKIKTLKFLFKDNLVDDDDRSQLYGVYCPIKNGITVNLPAHDSETILSLIDTIIHEYTHFKQDIKVMYPKYFDYYKYNDKNHPYEITARYRANKDRWLCYREVFGVNSI